MSLLQNRRLMIVTVWICGLAIVASDSADGQHANFDDRAIVMHAGGAVRLEIPETWSVSELPVGRRIRLLLTPPGGASQQKNAIDGIWLMLNYVRDGQPIKSDEELTREATDRLARWTRGLADVRSATMVTDGRQRWALADFALPSQPANRSTDSNELRGGIYLLQNVDWASLEVFVGWSVESQQALSDVYANEQVSQILKSIQMVRPLAPTGEISETVAAAESILGSWKASRSRMQLSPDGVITIVTDRPFEVEESGGREGLGEAERGEAERGEAERGEAKATAFGTDGRDNTEQPLVRLADTIQGRYRAEGDLLYTVWNDGSKLNYRWRRHQEALLLTDSEGRTSKLLPVLD